MQALNRRRKLEEEAEALRLESLSTVDRLQEEVDRRAAEAEALKDEVANLKQKVNILAKEARAAEAVAKAAEDRRAKDKEEQDKAMRLLRREAEDLAKTVEDQVGFGVWSVAFDWRPMLACLLAWVGRCSWNDKQ